MLSEYGYDFPTGKSITAINARNAIFEIIHPYIFSEEDLVTVRQTDPALKALWLETFTNSLKGMLHNNLNINAKYEFAGNFFPSRGALPPPDFGKLLGLEFGTSILHRQVNDLAFTFSTVSVHHGAGGQSQTELESSINNSFPAFRGPSPIARTKHHLRIRILKIMMKDFARNSEQQRRRVLCGTSTTFLSTNSSLTSAVFTLPTGLQ